MKLLGMPQAGKPGVSLSAKGTKAAALPIWFPSGQPGTQEKMTERAIQIEEKLAAKGKQLEEVSHEEFDEIAHSVGWHRHKPD